MRTEHYIAIPAAAIDDISCPGRDAAPYVARWANLIERPASCTPEAVACFVREAGGEPSEDDETNWHMMLWIVACDARDSAEINL